MTKFLITAATLPLLASIFALPAAADQRPELVIEDFVGTITLKTAANSSLEVTSLENNDDLTQEAEGDRLIINGGIAKPDSKKCKGYYGSWSWNERKSETFGGYEDLEDYPKLTITAPSDTVLVIRNSIPFIESGDLGGADLEIQACGKVNMGDISGDIRVELSGSGDVTAGDVENAELNLRGSGDVSIDNAQAVTANLTGSGDIVTGNMTRADLSLRGSGDVEFEDVSGAVNATLTGSGDINGGDIDGGVEAILRGSGDIELGDVTGPTRLESRGSGDIVVDGGSTEMLYIESSGSSTISYGGTAQNAELTASGSSDIYVERVKGVADMRESGSSDIEIDNRD